MPTKPCENPHCPNSVFVDSFGGALFISDEGIKRYACSLDCLRQLERHLSAQSDARVAADLDGAHFPSIPGGVDDAGKVFALHGPEFVRWQRDD